MTEIVPTPTGGSPFEKIKRTDEHGEHWHGRELMPLLDYDKWENFAEVIEKARVAIAAAGGDPDAHASRWQEASGRTRRANYRLTRYGAYVTAMVGDVKKAAVGAAITYFAIKTRQAETALAFDPSTLSRLDILRLAMQAEEEKAVLEAALESAAPAIAYHDRYVSDDDVQIIKVWGAQYGLTDPEARDLLVKKNIIYRLFIGERWSEKQRKKVPEYEWRARAGRVTFAWFDLRPQHNVARHHNGQVRQTLYVRQFFALELGRKVGLTSPVLPGTDVALRGGDAA